MDIKELRQKYPEYSDLSDDQLAKGFHEKFYSDMPFDEFSKKIGVGVSDKKPAKPLTVDVARNAMYGGLAAVPDALLNTPHNILNLVKMRAGKTLMDLGVHPDNVPQPTPPPNFTENALRKVGVIKEGVAPQGIGQKSVDVLLRGATAGALTGGGGLANTATGAGLGALSAGAATSAENLTGRPEAGVIAGLVVPAAASAAPAAARSASRRLMQSALKPSARDMLQGRGDRAIETLLDEGVNVSRAGAETLNARIESQNNAIARAIENSTARIDPGQASSRIRYAYRTFANQVDPHADLNAIDAVLRGFQTNPVIGGAPTIPVQLAQQLKQGTYQVLRGQYGERGSASTEANKALARGLKEEIAVAVPDIGSLNARESSLINARNLVERRAAVEGNKNPAGLSLLTKSPIAGLTFMADRSGAAKSLLARALNSGPGRLDVNTQNALASIGVPLSDAMTETEKRNVIKKYAAHYGIKEKTLEEVR